MMKGTNRLTARLLLLVLITECYSLPAFAQTSPLPPTVEQQDASPPQSSGARQPESAYILGAGDLLKIDSYDTPDLVLETRYSVLPDGSVNLPWVGSLPVAGLTLKQASDRLKTAYGKFIKNPTVTVGLIAARTLKIGVIGEVTRPGSYIIASNLVSSSAVSTTGTTQNILTGQQGGNESGSQWPTVSKAIQAAGGITEQADIRQIQIRRQGSLETEPLTVNLWAFLSAGDLTQDVQVRDGDTIVIPKATSVDTAEALQVASSNFSPDAIKVNVVGEVSTPGAVAVKPNTTLNQAILAAGGFKGGRAKKAVELIRLNPDGTVSRRTIAVNLSQNLDEKSNPPLRNNDVVVVNRNAIAQIGDTVGTFLGPLTGVLGLFTIFGR
ncbi:polysaccharide biosynthesis/export family protein [Phormidium sp. FACHB-592]|uniref:Polysaccharide biosynthesis/export family protein n=1 Tax=Stenomitos frigidus AS-A4 TaxID=2933935 RepID=A0ABV0KLJ4_9CYAN|nr:polysaccharide biosynthesis/export family protein [Phormidium sp. FACHB-592]MBD2075034.1 polysaccharide biosynthesis/export family protein [Phormidium sp. FACHB-592]